MATKSEFISTVFLQVYEGAPSDDANLEEREVAFWGTFHLNQLVANELNEKLKRGEQFPSVYKKRAACEVLSIEEAQCGDGCQDRVYVQLPEDVLTINKDAGIVRVTTDEGDLVTKGSTETLDILRYMPYAKPSNENLVYYRESAKIFVEGIKNADVPFNELNVVYIPKQDIAALGNDDEILASDLVLPQLIDLVVQRAKMELYGSQQDVANDGTDGVTTKYHELIKNPANNEPNQ